MKMKEKAKIVEVKTTLLLYDKSISSKIKLDVVHNNIVAL